MAFRPMGLGKAGCSCFFASREGRFVSLTGGMFFIVEGKTAAFSGKGEERDGWDKGADRGAGV